MSIVYLAEKPSQAKDIAAVLGVKSRKTGYIEVSSNSVVTWVIGHLLEQAMPEEYKEEWAKWNWEHLPMIPDKWKNKVVKQKAAQLKVIGSLLKSATKVVIATDAGREGELIARETLEHLKWKGPVERLWTSSLAAADIKKALASLKPGSATIPLFEAARGRSHADWLYGMNGSRAVTLAAKEFGIVYPVGRVQTPTLAMVVRREWAIRNFKPVTYYELQATVQPESGQTFVMTHAPAEDKRILDRKEAERRKAQADGAQGPLKVTTSKGSESPPLPYTLSALQKDANKTLGLSARQTLTTAQELYEAKVISYPRTDCPYLAETQKGEVPATLARLDELYPAAVKALRDQGTSLRSSVFNDSKLSDHHGICPTSEKGAIPANGAKLYALIAERYLRAIAQDCLFDKTLVEMDANGVPFKATGKVIKQPGWRGIKV
jgi:DNA topoisomerase III